MMRELKPCPFCGGEADVHYFAHDDSECTVMCSNLNCRASVSARSCGSMTTAYNRARKLWNRRAERMCRIVSAFDTDELEHVQENISFSPEDTLAYRCEGCGFDFRYERGLYPSYCPNCGARVVDA